MNFEADDSIVQKINLNDFFQDALCGYVITDAAGKIIKANNTVAAWLGCPVNDLFNRRTPDLLSVGGKIYYETHLWPLLKMQGFFDEVALELSCGNQQRLPVLINALEHKDENGTTQYVWFTILRAKDRRTYEQNLKDAKTSLEISLANAHEVTLLREQLIAVLGHDLRNPLGSVLAASSILSKSNMDEADAKMVQVISRSALRMAELISNIMDFARTRLGEGIIVNRQPTEIDPFLYQVVDELRTIYPNRQIDASFNCTRMILCDGARMAQLLSNLVANAITHGYPTTPVLITTDSTEENFVLTVTNQGNPISVQHIEKLFEPFTRESQRASQNGVGLGLYIASQVAKAHKGELTVKSTEKNTQFTFRLFNKF